MDCAFCSFNCTVEVCCQHLDYYVLFSHFVCSAYYLVCLLCQKTGCFFKVGRLLVWFLPHSFSYNQVIYLFWLVQQQSGVAFYQLFYSGANTVFFIMALAGKKVFEKIKTTFRIIEYYKIKKPLVYL
jgi:hypothetical protein